ncbi:MAG: hypothetical protein FJX71_04105 [Alphaproteobacteria bacterium]|nr:hypothetical protein [Alphaproteobacteria bacterium]
MSIKYLKDQVLTTVNGGANEGSMIGLVDTFLATHDYLPTKLILSGNDKSGPVETTITAPVPSLIKAATSGNN